MTTPTPNLSWTDPHTWMMIGSIVAAIVLNVFHDDVTPWVPAAAVIAAAIVTAAVSVSKHHFAAAIAGAPAALAAAAAQVPATGRAVALKAADVAQGALELLDLTRSAPATAVAAASVPPVTVPAPLAASGAVSVDPDTTGQVS